MKKQMTFLFLFMLSYLAHAQSVEFVRKDAERKVDVMIGGKFFTSYFYPDEAVLKKPVLFPILTAHGTTITRGFPLAPRTGERTDHPHHVGLWLNYEYVNGMDYWNNSTAIKPEQRKEKYGLIRHTGISKIKNGKVGKLKVTADWIEKDGTGKVVLKETTSYIFSGNDSFRIIDRETRLTAFDTVVAFNDVKDGLFGLRVARELEHPSEKPEIFTDAHGVETKVPVINNNGVVGHYHSSDGIEGENVWSTRAKWMGLSGKIGNEDIDIFIFDHPKNINYPTYWHARPYGLLALNPLGEKVFSNGKKTLNLKLKKGESLNLKYRIVIKSGKISNIEANKIADDFSK